MIPGWQDRPIRILIIASLFSGVVTGIYIVHPDPIDAFTGTSRPVDQSQTLGDPESESPTNTTSAGRSAPDSVTDGKTGYSIRFRRPSNDTQLFDRYLHDPTLVRGENDTLYLIAAGWNGSNQVLYSADMSSPTNWELIDGHYLGNEGAIDDIVYANNRYIAYANNGIYTTADLKRDDWTRQADAPPNTNDLGAYYDGERVHIYYEENRHDVSGPSGKAIGHAISPNGITNWTRYPDVFHVSDEYVVGDFEIIALKRSILVFGDYSRKHPKYEIRIWMNDDPYTDFTLLREPAIEPRNRNTRYTDDFGVQDATVIQLNGSRYLMIANGHDSLNSYVRLHYYIGQATVSGP